MAAFAPGVPALREFPQALWRRMLERAWRSLSAAQLNYGDPAGEMALRVAIADHLRVARGVVCDPQQVFITDGTQDSLDLCARAFTDTGDRVWMENPGYRGALTAWLAAGLQVSGIAVDGDGIAPGAQDWQQHSPKLIYVTPSHQYPLGSVLGLGRRLALLEGASRCGALIVEDDYDSEFRHDGPPLPAMQGLAPDAPVIYLGTFSKTMFPALRIGFMVVPQAVAAPLTRLCAVALPRGRAAEQLALADFLHSGQFARHIRRMRRLYRQRRDALVAALERHLGAAATIHGASAGMHLALRLSDEGLADTAVSACAWKRGLDVRPLSTHATGGAAHANGFLLGYAQVPAEEMDGLAARLAAALRETAS
jgi:GntR family transcriptional regulator/MocR family aminotransferase